MKKTQLMLMSPAQTRFQQTHMPVTVCASAFGSVSVRVVIYCAWMHLSRCSEAAEAAAAAVVLSRDEEHAVPHRRHFLRLYSTYETYCATIA